MYSFYKVELWEPLKAEGNKLCLPLYDLGNCSKYFVLMNIVFSFGIVQFHHV